MKVTIGIFGLQMWFGGEFAPVVELMQIADRKGVDQVNMAEHVVMSEAIDKYPYGTYSTTPDFPWFEPISVLSAIAGATKNIRLSTGILISPLRSAVLLAKQVATLDVMSRGRVDLGVGVGWQREEFEASGIPFKSRYTCMDEQIRVCRKLWSEAPVTFDGETVKLKRIYSLPYPIQGANLPVWYGVAPTPRNCARMAELGSGWIPMVNTPEAIADGVQSFRAAFTAIGRDFSDFSVRVGLNLIKKGDALDLNATFAQVPALAKAGVTHLEVYPIAMSTGPADFESFVERILPIKRF